jgi:hypothetical protein
MMIEDINMFAAVARSGAHDRGSLRQPIPDFFRCGKVRLHVRTTSLVSSSLMKGGRNMGRYKTEHKTVDVSPIPLITMLAKKTVMTDTETNRKAEGYDWSSFRKSDRKALERLRSG